MRRGSEIFVGCLPGVDLAHAPTKSTPGYSPAIPPAVAKAMADKPGFNCGLAAALAKRASPFVIRSSNFDLSFPLFLPAAVWHDACLTTVIPGL